MRACSHLREVVVDRIFMCASKQLVTSACKFRLHLAKISGRKIKPIDSKSSKSHHGKDNLGKPSDGNLTKAELIALSKREPEKAADSGGQDQLDDAEDTTDAGVPFDIEPGVEGLYLKSDARLVLHNEEDLQKQCSVNEVQGERGAGRRPPAGRG